MKNLKLIFLVTGILFLSSCGENQKKHFSLIEATISELQHAVKSGQTSCRSIVEGYIKRIETYDQSKKINSIVQINPNALNKAEGFDIALSKGEELPDLFCVPVLVKDNYDTHDMLTTGGSIALKDSYPPDDSFMVRKLREAGAIVLAKTNMAEWAFSPRESVSSSYGRTTNAYDQGFVPAGSSGGTASATAANFGLVGMGSDTGNSIRGPSSHLALFGIRSTIGLTSRDGVIPLAFDRDIAGPMTRTVEDGARIFNVIAGYDPADSLTIANKREDDYNKFLNIDGLKGKRLGVLRALLDQEGADPEIKALFMQALEDLKIAGAIIIDPIEIEDFDFHKDNDDMYCPTFRYDMWNYLKSLGPSAPINDVIEVLETGQHSPEAKSGLEYFKDFPLGKPSEDWAEPCIRWPNSPSRQAYLNAVVMALDEAEVDAIIYPGWSNPPAPINNAIEEYKGDNSQIVAPATGMPAVVVPMGFWQNKLPTGLQILGRPYSEGLLIELAYAYEQKTNHRKPPDGFGELK